MHSLGALFGAYPPIWVPLALGAAGAACVLAGGLLRGRLHPGLRFLGACFCVTGLGLMSIGLLCLSGRLAPA